MPETTTKPLLTAKELHAALGGTVGINTLYTDPRVRRVRIGRKVMFPASEVEEFIKRAAEGGQAAA